MSKISPQFIIETQDFWEPRLGYRPDKTEAEEMIRNVSNFFLILLDWTANEMKSKELEERGLNDEK